MNRAELEQFISENLEDERFFTGGVDESKIRYIEEQLKVILPESYKWFLRTYGMGGFWGIEILGFDKVTPPSSVTQTERYRRLGLPETYVVIEGCDEFVYCLATDRMHNGECPVVFWDRQGLGGERGSDFYQFLSTRLLDAKEDEDYQKELDKE